jgi:UDP-N-acetylmuramyl pentapeptide phosphotransferase/UDP-N-acetylglucosamine-1-phosphate transferase
MSWIFIIHLFFTLYMTGVIWFVQVVHYPLMGKIGAEAFEEYEKHHQKRTFLIVGIQMIIELFTGLLLLWQQSYNPLQWWNVILLIIIWISTFFIQSPLHGKLGNEYRAEWQQKLVHTNWIRTVAWTLRSLILLSMLV